MTPIMNKDIDPQVYTRTGGLLYLIVIALSITQEACIRGHILSSGDAAAMFANLQQHVFGSGIALLLSGPFLFSTGSLIFTSGYLPKPVGILYQLAGLAYVCNGFALMLAPQLAGRMFLFMALPAFAGETSFAVWLLFKGVGIERWRSCSYRFT
jgi:hypothetical protein